jgi:hypothetical protein
MKFMLAPQQNLTVEPQYQLASGTHYHNGRPYRHGDVIESDENLQEKFPGKFTCVPDDTPVTPPRKGTSSKPGGGRPTDEFEDPRFNKPHEATEEAPPESVE